MDVSVQNTKNARCLILSLNYYVVIPCRLTCQWWPNLD